MATVRSVITGALRKLSVVGGVGRRTPTDVELSDSLHILLGMYRSLITSGAFGRMRDVVPVGDYIAGENQRIYKRFDIRQNITLPDQVSWCGSCGYTNADFQVSTPAPLIIDPDAPVPSCDYGVRPYGLWDDASIKRPVRDGAVVTMVDEFSGDILEAIYDGQRKLWFTLTDLATDEELDESNEWSIKRLNNALDLEAPLSHRDNNGLTCLLATMLADDFGVDQMPAMTAMLAQQFRRELASNYSTYKRDDYIEWRNI